MFKTILLCTLLLCFSFYGVAQRISSSVIAAAGETSKTDQITLDWTMGEIAVETFPTAGGMLTQGFHQPLLILPSNYVELFPRPGAPGFTVKINPNPVRALLYISLKSFDNRKVNINLSDVNGKFLYNTSTNTKEGYVIIDMQQYASGIYLLFITNPLNSSIYTYKIVKAN